MIEIGENPEKIKGINKFIGQDGDGYRGKLIAIHKDKKRAIILAENSGSKVDWGNFYLVAEKKAHEWPIVIAKISCVPNEEGWKVV